MNFAADYSQQHCPLQSAALLIIVSSIADYCQHQEFKLNNYIYNETV